MSLPRFCLPDCHHKFPTRFFQSHFLCLHFLSLHFTFSGTKQYLSSFFLNIRIFSFMFCLSVCLPVCHPAILILQFASESQHPTPSLSWYQVTRLFIFPLKAKSKATSPLSLYLSLSNTHTHTHIHTHIHTLTHFFSLRLVDAYL